MTDILTELYSSSLFFGREFSEEYKALCKKDEELWEKVLPILGLDIVDELHNSHASICDETNLRWFRDGFRLGARLMLEVLKD